MRVYIEEKGYTCVMGLHASLNGLALVIVQTQANKAEWYIKDEFITYDLDLNFLNSYKEIIEEFVKKYKIRNFLGNVAAQPLYVAKYLTQWETMKLKSDEIIWAIETNSEKITFEESIEPNWNKEIDWVDFKASGEKDRPYLRIYALSYVLIGVHPYNCSWMLTQENYERLYRRK